MTNLLTPYVSPALRLPNRVAMAPMTRFRADAVTGVPHAATAAYYAQRASAALIVTEGVFTEWRGRGEAGVPGLLTDGQAAGWAGVTTAVHAAGGRIFAQLWHVGRLNHHLNNPGAERPIAPSAVAAEGLVRAGDAKVPFEVPEAMTAQDIDAVIAGFAEAARKAVAAGFDGVEIHGANGYLFKQFHGDNTNLRTDGYGGSVNGRVRFTVETVEAVAEAVGAERVGLRVSPDNPENGVAESDPAGLYRVLATTLDPRGLAYLHVSEKGRYPAIADLRKHWSGTLIGNHDPADPTDRATGEAMIAAGHADIVAYGRSFIANPDLPRRFATGAPLAGINEEHLYAGVPDGYTDYAPLPHDGTWS
ncbi:alkene reductase [Actinorhabdospora filicis]|uniref:Alkene reductase n=1 Tax=Actinorhabdospora filicis TaxID=1785913 RepID=A0A9W6SQ97_9ACTN|nr:alkene reductase [Actinorhabdospora filicis]GLZ80143.1 alkene reductase [Actinorhabdospora filicis]